VATWGEFEEAAPEIADAGRALLYQFGPGLGFLATVRKDGGPRVHPVCPLIVDGRLWVLVGAESPKVWDLVRDGRYALHSFPSAGADDEFFVTGPATKNVDGATRAAVSAAVKAQGTTHGETDVLFELGIERAMHAKYPGPSPSWPPEYRVWRER